jgi:hypothetical protein
MATPTPVALSSTAETLGFLGSTSFSEVFKASRVHQSDNVWLEPLANVKNSLRTPSTYWLHADRINAGAKILDMFTDFPSMNRMIEQYYSCSQIAVAPLITMKNSMDSLQKSLDEHTTRAQRLLLAEQIFANTFTPLLIDQDITPENLHLSMTGDKLRWEIIGLLFTTIGLGSMLENNEPQPTRLKRQRYTGELTHASNLVISLCDRSESLNDILIWLLHGNSVLLTFQYGEASTATPPPKSMNSVKNFQVILPGVEWAIWPQVYSQWDYIRKVINQNFHSF